MGKRRQFAAVFMVAMIMSIGSCAEALQDDAALTWLGESNKADAQIIQPRYSYTDQISAALSFSGGQAICSGKIVPSGDRDVSITVTLYKKNGSNWNYITSWSGSAKNGLAAVAGGSISVDRGTYKVVSSGNVEGLEYPTATVERTY